MPEIITPICFAGLSSTGVITLATENLVKAGDRLIGVCDLTTGDGSCSSYFGELVAANDKIIQLLGADISTHRFMAIVVRG